MTIKRIRDPAGLLGDLILIDDLGSSLPGSPEFIAFHEALEFGDPIERIKRLQARGDMHTEADSLHERCIAKNGNADMRLLLAIRNAEVVAFYNDAAPLVIRDSARQRGTRLERRPEVTRWIDEQLAFNPDAKSTDLWKAAPDWLTEQIGDRRFASRVTARRKARASK